MHVEKLLRVLTREVTVQLPPIMLLTTCTEDPKDMVRSVYMGAVS